MNLCKFFVLTFLILVLSFCKNAPAKPRNIILITIDTLRADAISVYGSKTPTPFMQRFADQGVVFERAFTTAPITLPAHVSLFTGLYPPSHGVRHNGVYRAAESLNMLPEIARKKGLDTGAFVGAAPVGAIYGLNQGFNRYDDTFEKMGTQPGVFIFPERSAEQVRLAAQHWLSNRTNTKPYFLWLHFFDPHHPYKTHGYADRNPYDQEVEYTDHQLGQFFEFLNQRNDKDNLVIITSDHGEAFGEHGEVSHSLFVYNTTLRIPLMISAPGIKPAKYEQLVRIIDISPTVADLMGWEIPPNIDGVSLAALMRGEKLPALESYSESFASAIDFGWSPIATLQDVKFKYIHAPKPELYKIDSDPSEMKNMVTSTQSMKYKSKIETLLTRRSPEDSEHSPSPEELERLRSLGYVGGARQKIRWDGADPKDRVEVARRIAELTMKPMAPKEREEEYRNLVQLDPANPLLFVRYGEILLQNKNYPGAQTMFEKAIELQYPSAAPFNGLAAAYFYQERQNEAEAVLQKAVNQGLADGETYFNLAEFLYNRGKLQEAFAYYDRSTELGHKLAPLRKAELLQSQSR